MSQPTPRARTILLTDSGTLAFSAALAAFDGTALTRASIDNTIVTSTLPISTVDGAVAVFTGLYARLATITERAAALQTRKAAIAARIALLEL